MLTKGVMELQANTKSIEFIGGAIVLALSLSDREFYFSYVSGKASDGQIGQNVELDINHHLRLSAFQRLIQLISKNARFSSNWCCNTGYLTAVLLRRQKRAF